MIFGLLTISSLASSCDQAYQKIKEEANKAVSKTNESVHKGINELGLVYFKDVAKSMIMYDEVNIAQQTCCDALVKIEQRREEGGDYKSLVEQVLTDAYNYDNGKLF